MIKKNSAERRRQLKFLGILGSLYKNFSLPHKRFPHTKNHVIPTSNPSIALVETPVSYRRVAELTTDREGTSRCSKESVPFCCTSAKNSVEIRPSHIDTNFTTRVFPTPARPFLDVSLSWRLSVPEGKATVEARLEDMEAVGASRGSEL